MVFVMRYKGFCFVFVLTVLVLTVGSAPSHAGWLQFLFPDFSNEPHPAETLKAPFADDDAVIVDMDITGKAANRMPLHLRHRTNAVMTRWVQQNIPNMLSYKAQTYKKAYGGNIVYFTKVGADEYLKFLQDKSFLTTLETGRYDIAGFIRDYPILLNEGAIDGYYRWLYQVNIMVTYIESGVSDYNALKSGDAITQEFVVNFQLGRHKDVDNEHGVLIETWSVRSKSP
ncbi:MAG: hypothetical protein COA45_08595 [Zetaproteobacteria bacterium]|nr:MAG: hypothetical protein COA45_08595 [Zetaproteobacteria bacterium]